MTSRTVRSSLRLVRTHSHIRSATIYTMNNTLRPATKKQLHPQSKSNHTNNLHLNQTQNRPLSSLIPKDDDKDKPATIPSSTSDVLVPINFDTSSSIKGEESQILEIDLEPNQILRAESGAMIYMTQGVEMSTSLGGSGSNTGTGASISDGFKRMLTGQNMFISDYSYQGPEGSVGTVALGTDFPSKIIRLSLQEYGNKIVCQKSAYLASDLNVDIQLEFAKKFTAGFFGGEGFILQGLIGDGDVFVKAGG